MFISVKHHVFAALSDCQRQNLFFEMPCLDRSSGPLMALEGQRVLGAAINVACRRHIFRSHAHMAIAKRVRQRAGHHVGGTHIVHFCTKARSRHQMADAAHVFSATGKNDITVAQHDLFGGGNNDLQSAAAQPVQCQRWR